MARYLALWHLNPFVQFPTDPSKLLELNEKMWAVMDDQIKKGMVKEFGVFQDGTSGYLIAEGNATDVFTASNMFMPYIIGESHEIIPYEKQKEIIRALCKAQIAATKK